MPNYLRPLTRTEWAVAFGVALCSGLIAFQGNDLRMWVFAARDLLHGVDPYWVPQLINPISVPLLFVPAAPWNVELVLHLSAWGSALIYTLVILREKSHWFSFLVLMLSPFFLYNVFYVNLDALVFAALLVPPVPAFLLAFIKPQIGLIVAALAALELWRHRRRAIVLGLLALEILIFAVSFAMGMSWRDPLRNFGNTALFPWGLVIGLPLTWRALVKRDPVLALAAMPFCSPYVGPQSWIVLLPAAARHKGLAVAVTVIGWLAVLVWQWDRR